MEPTSPHHLDLSYKKQKMSVVLISLAFMSTFSAYSPLQTIITKIYMDFGYEYFGPISLGIMYLSYALFSSLAPIVINRLGHKTIFIIGAISFAIYQVSGMIIYFFGKNIILAWLVLVIPSLLCGMSSVCIWVAQSNYVGIISEDKHRDEMIGLFYAFRSCASLIGYIINLFLLTQFGQIIYFSVLIPIGAISIIIFCFLPHTREVRAKNKQIVVNTSFQKQIIQFFQLLTIRQNFSIYFYSTLSGIIGAFSAVTMFQIGLSIVPEIISAETSSQHTKTENYYIGIVLLFFGVSQTLMGFLAKKIYKYCNFYQMSFYICIALLLVTILTALAFYLKILVLNCFISFCWGTLFTLQRVNSNSLYSKHFKNNINMMGILQFLYAFTFSVFSILLAVLIKQSIYLVFIILGFAFFKITFDSWSIRKLQDEAGQTKQLSENSELAV